MENNRKPLKLALTVVVFGLGAYLSSCKSSSDPINSEITQTVSNESAQDAQQDEVDDISTGQLNSVDGANPRVATTSDDRVACALITRDTTSDKTQGSITINFDENSSGTANASGCTDGRGNIRKGSITITWSGGHWWKVGSVTTITMTNYSINGVVINGTRVLTNVSTDVSTPAWTIVMTNATATWPDNSVATRSVAKTRTWNISAGTVTVTQTSAGTPSASGTTRYGKSYTVQITVPLVYSAVCTFIDKVYIPVSGTKVITIDTSKEITIDYGNGSCNKSFTITFDGKTETITASND